MPWLLAYNNHKNAEASYRSEFGDLNDAMLSLQTFIELILTLVSRPTYESEHCWALPQGRIIGHLRQTAFRSKII